MFILAVGIGLIFFYVVAQKTIDSSSQERMKTNVARQSEHLRTILNIHYSYLEGVAEKIAESNELMNEENKEVLTVFQKNTSLDRDMLPSYRTMKYKSPIWGYFHVQKE